MPGPTSYKADTKIVRPRAPAVKFAPTKTKKQASWKPVKSKEPDCGTYDLDKGRHFVEKSPIIPKISKISPSPSTSNLKEGQQSGSAAVQSKETFTTMISNSKKWLPGVGSYTPKVEFVTIPYGRKRM